MLYNLYTVLIMIGSVLSIHLISTIPERLVIFTVILLILYQLNKRLALTKNKRLISILFAGTITLLISTYLSSEILRKLPVIFTVLVLALFLSSMRLPFAKRKKLVSTVVAGLITISISANVLSDLHRFIFPDQAVTRFAKDDFNSLALDMNNHVLHVVAHDKNSILSFNIDALNAPPKLSEVETGFARTFLYNDQLKEIYNYNKIKQQLDILDSAELTIKESIPIQFPPGVNIDTWIEMDPRTGYIIVAALPRGKHIDKATVIVNRTEKKIVKELSLSPMNILLHPSKSLLYLSFFQERYNEVIIYDLESLEISNRTLINSRMDRMAFLESANELLVTAPTRSIIYRLDADTLALKGEIKSSFGVRTMAVDRNRNLLLTVSLVTNILDVINLRTYQSIKRYYLSPWLRSIVLDGNGIAYVSSISALFRVNYAKQ